MVLVLLPHPVIVIWAEGSSKGSKGEANPVWHLAEPIWEKLLEIVEGCSENECPRERIFWKNVKIKKLEMLSNSTLVRGGKAPGAGARFRFSN